MRLKELSLLRQPYLTLGSCCLYYRGGTKAIRTFATHGVLAAAAQIENAGRWR